MGWLVNQVAENLPWQKQWLNWFNLQVAQIKFKITKMVSGGVDEINFRKSVQMVFQDPAESLNSRMTVGSIIGEPLDVHKIGDKSERLNRVEELLEQVGLSKSSVKRYPFEFSGVSVNELVLPEHWH